MNNLGLQMCSQNRARLYVVNLWYILQHTDGKCCGEPQSRKEDRRHCRAGGVLFYVEWPWESSEDDLWAKTRVGWAGPMAPWMKRVTDRRRRHWWGQRAKTEQGRKGTSTGKRWVGSWIKPYPSLPRSQKYLIMIAPRIAPYQNTRKPSNFSGV